MQRKHTKKKIKIKNKINWNDDIELEMLRNDLKNKLKLQDATIKYWYRENVDPVDFPEKFQTTLI